MQNGFLDGKRLSTPDEQTPREPTPRGPTSSTIEIYSLMTIEVVMGVVAYESTGTIVHIFQDWPVPKEATPRCYHSRPDRCESRSR